MAPPIPPPDCVYGIWLTAPSVSGGKSWVAFRTPFSVEIHWGKINQINQRKTVELNHSLPKTVLDDMARKKFAKGYQVAQEWEEGPGWQDRRGGGPFRTGRQQQPLPPPPPPKPIPSTPIQSESSRKRFARQLVETAVNTWRNSPSKSSTENGLPDEWF